MLRGRPHGGVAILSRRTAFKSVSTIKCISDRLAAIKVSDSVHSILIFCVYMPTDKAENLPEFTACLGELSAIIDSEGADSVVIMDDFNAHPGEPFNCELLKFCSDQAWVCLDYQLLPADSFTFISEAQL